MPDTETTSMDVCVEIFLECNQAIAQGSLIRRLTRQDKEFHFQNWFEQRLKEAKVDYEQPGRNSYPDFTLVKSPMGYEIKGLAWPGREADYDCNSQVPTGSHNGRTIYYVFGRYPSGANENEYPVIDLIICHGDFLNSNHDYIHKNKSFSGFGSYGDLKIRDRKMYIAPTPYGLLTGVDRQVTLILPQDYPQDSRLQSVGNLTRIEAEQQVIGYSFNLNTNQIMPEYKKNPSSGKTHSFVAYRPRGINSPTVAMKH
jgi:hypothetical protein